MSGGIGGGVIILDPEGGSDAPPEDLPDEDEDEMNEAHIRELKETYLECGRCHEVVSLYENIGQWRCHYVRTNPLTAQPYYVHSDHGDVKKQPVIRISIELALALPKMQKEALHLIREHVNGEEQYDVEIARLDAPANPCSAEFVWL